MKRNNFILYMVILLHVACHSAGQRGEAALTVQTFSDLPEAIDGCSCLISEHSTAFRNGEYVYADNLQDIGYIRIDGEMHQLALDQSAHDSDMELVTTGRNDAISFKLDLRKSDQLDYVGSYFGTLEITTNDGRKTKKTVFGECGC